VTSTKTRCPSVDVLLPSLGPVTTYKLQCLCGGARSDVLVSNSYVSGCNQQNTVSTSCPFARELPSITLFLHRIFKGVEGASQDAVLLGQAYTFLMCVIVLQDMRDECGKHGPLKRVIIPRPTPTVPNPPGLAKVCVVCWRHFCIDWSPPMSHYCLCFSFAHLCLVCYRPTIRFVVCCLCIQIYNSYYTCLGAKVYVSFFRLDHWRFLLRVLC